MLVTDRCERGCMREVYAAIPAAAESMVRPRVQGILDQTIGACPRSHPPTHL
jgi:hypothetical protein